MMVGISKQRVKTNRNRLPMVSHNKGASGIEVVHSSCETLEMLKRILGTFVLLNLTTQACFYYPLSYKDTITENTREFFLFHDAEDVHVILQTHFSAKKELPVRLTWVIPFQVLPKKYEEAHAQIFEELQRITGSFGAAIMRPGSKGAEGSGSGGVAPPPVKAHHVQQVGDYKVHPLEIVSDVDPKHTASVLDDWLRKKNFNTIPFDLQKPYLKKGATFLAIEMNPKGKEASSKPLHIIFPKTGEYFSIPLRLTHDDRVFDLRIYTFGFQKAWLYNNEIWNKHLHDGGYGTHFPQQEDETTAVSKLLRGQQGYLQDYALNGFNRPGGLRARQLTEDPTFQWQKTIPAKSR
jgi:hypothetical protein